MMTNYDDFSGHTFSREGRPMNPSFVYIIIYVDSNQVTHIDGCFPHLVCHKTEVRELVVK